MSFLLRFNPQKYATSYALIAVSIVSIAALVNEHIPFSVEDIGAIAFTLLAASTLFKAHKTSWLVAIISLIVGAVSMLFRVCDGFDTQSQLLTAVQILHFVVASGALIFVFYRARYPYLDRRQGWFKAPADRFDVHTDVTVIAEREFDGTTESLSMSGCRVRLKAINADLSRRFVDIRFKGIPGVVIRAQKVGFDSAVVRLKFKEFVSGRQKGLRGLGPEPLRRKKSRLKSKGVKFWADPPKSLV